MNLKNNQNKNHTIQYKWTSTSIYIDENTGEIISSEHIKNKEYKITKKTKNVKNIGICEKCMETTFLCKKEKFKQSSLNFE